MVSRDTAEYVKARVPCSMVLAMALRSVPRNMNESPYRVGIAFQFGRVGRLGFKRCITKNDCNSGSKVGVHDVYSSFIVLRSPPGVRIPFAIMFMSRHLDGIGDRNDDTRRTME